MFGSRSKRWVLLCFVVPAITIGILAMHGLSTADGAGVMHHADVTATSVDRIPMPEPTMADHGLAPCVWLLVGGIAVLLAAARFVRLRGSTRAWRCDDPLAAWRSEPRGPPSAVRLSLVGVSRR